MTIDEFTKIVSRLAWVLYPKGSLTDRIEKFGPKRFS